MIPNVLIEKNLNVQIEYFVMVIKKVNIGKTMSYFKSRKAENHNKTYTTLYKFKTVGSYTY